MDLVLIRHARPAVDDGVCYGRLDLPLAEPMAPAAQAIVAAARAAASANGVPPPARMVASPARRAHATAQRIAQTGTCLADSPALQIHCDARLLELDFGAWEGQRWDAVPRDGLDQWAADLMDARPHGGESARTAYTRIGEWADSLSASEPAPCLWVVGHAGPMRMLAAHWLGLPLSVTLGWQLGWGASCGFRLDARGGPGRLLWWNRAAG